MANTLDLFRNEAVGVIDCLGCGVVSPIPTEKHLRNATKGQGAHDCSDSDPLPARRSKRQKPEAITEGNNSAKDEKWPRKAAVNPTASGSVKQASCAHDRKRHWPQNRFQPSRCTEAQCKGDPRYAPKKESTYSSAQQI